MVGPSFNFDPSDNQAEIMNRLAAIEQAMAARDAEHEAALASRDAVIAERDEAIAKRDAKIAELTALVDQLRSRIFGRRTERREGPGQLDLFEVDEPAPAPIIEQCQPAPDRKRSRQKTARDPFPDHLPRNEIPVDPPEAERICECCNKPLVRIGEDVVERLEAIPQRFVVNRYVSGRWACPNRDGRVQQKSIPPSLIDRSRYETSVYVMLVVAKYMMHTPLHRMQADFRGQGLELSRSTMWELVERVGALLDPVVRQMEREILATDYLQMDDTFLTVVSPTKKGSRRGHLWVIRHRDKVVYRFSEKRNREVPKALTAEWPGGFLQADGHDSFALVEARPDVLRVGCWAHARRLWIKAEKLDPQVTSWFLRMIGRAFRVERILKHRRDAEGMDEAAFHQLRFDVRQRLTRRILDAIEARRRELVTGDRPPLPKSPVGMALSYLASQGESLRNVLASGVVELDNNASERDLRHAVIGRKNWQVTSDQRGVEVMTRLFSIMVSCKAADVHPEAYLRDVLPRLSTTPESQLASLTPWAWAAARDSSPAN